MQEKCNQSYSQNKRDRMKACWVWKQLVTGDVTKGKVGQGGEVQLTDSKGCRRE